MASAAVVSVAAAVSVVAAVSAVTAGGSRAAVSHRPAADPSGFDPGLASFRISVGDLEIPHTVFALSVLPRETLRFRGVPPVNPDSLFFVAPPDVRRDTTGAEWTWRAPGSHGLTIMRIVNLARGDTMTLNLFTMVPKSAVKKGVLNGYRIGSYPASRKDVKPPSGFIEVTPQNLETPVAPHFTLGQFLCKQESAFPKYLVLDGELLLYLEELLEAVNRPGHAASTFAILSGYRTPHHNRALRNAHYSQHLWGRAADIFIDESPRDGMMDDLNGDGVVNRADAEEMRVIVESLEASGNQPGGLSAYPGTDSHGPFVHVDVRGTRARW